MLTLEWLIVAVATSSLSTSSGALVKPSWGYFETASFAQRNRAACVNGSRNDSINTRWVHYALPEGKPPLYGWPVYVIFPPWQVTPNDHAIKKNATCGGHNKSFSAPYPPFYPPGKISTACFTANGSFTGAYNPNCSFGNLNGQMWWQRVNQYLLANGIAVVQINVYRGDWWDWPTPAGWRDGADRPFLRTLFKQWSTGPWLHILSRQRCFRLIWKLKFLLQAPLTGLMAAYSTPTSSSSAATPSAHRWSAG
jgi:hypothetical protein